MALGTVLPLLLYEIIDKFFLVATSPQRNVHSTFEKFLDFKIQNLIYILLEVEKPSQKTSIFFSLQSSQWIFQFWKVHRNSPIISSLSFILSNFSGCLCHSCAHLWVSKTEGKCHTRRGRIRFQIIVLFFSFENSRTDRAAWADALSWCKNRFIICHFSARFRRIFSRTRLFFVQYSTHCLTSTHELIMTNNVKHKKQSALF